jgi:hypothetical protein
MKRAVASLDVIENRILLIRGHKVMIDADLAAVYGVTTKRLNEQVKRNRERFPEDFMFQLTEVEKAEVVAICNHHFAIVFNAIRELMEPPPASPKKPIGFVRDKE